MIVIIIIAIIIIITESPPRRFIQAFCSFWFDLCAFRISCYWLFLSVFCLCQIVVLSIRFVNLICLPDHVSEPEPPELIPHMVV